MRSQSLQGSTGMGVESQNDAMFNVRSLQEEVGTTGSAMHIKPSKFCFRCDRSITCRVDSTYYL